MIRSNIIVFILLLCLPLEGQYSIQFRHDVLDEVLVRAKQEGKKVFIDTYAPWCVPCKKMNKVFRDPEVADYFNEKFINVKINMDGRLGDRFHIEYRVVFLPTLIFLDPNGNVLYKNDQLMTQHELLAIGRTIAEPEIYPPVIRNVDLAKVTEPLVEEVEEIKNPVVVVKPEKPISNPVAVNNEKILFVLDSTGSNMDPEYLYNVAYLKLQLNAPDKQQAAHQYLETQEDWTTEENMSFIFDFLYTTDDTTFRFFIENRTDFENLKGPNEVARTIDIMTHMKLEQGFPRPSFEEAKKILSFIDPEYGERKAFAYFLDRYYNESDYKKYLIRAKEYLDEIDSEDAEVMYKMCKISRKFNDEYSPKDLLKWIKKAIAIQPSNHRYHLMQAHLHYDNGQKQKSLSAAKKALNAAEKSGAKTGSIDSFIERIKKM